MNTNTYDKTTDLQELVHQAQSGNREAKEYLCQRFQGFIYQLSHTAYETLEREDMRQDLWIYFLEYLQDYDAKQGVSFLAYITIRMKWRVKDLCRKHQRKLDHEIGACTNETMNGIVSGDIAVDSGTPNWYEVDAIEQGKRNVKSLVEEIPLTMRQKEMLLLHLAGNSWQEVAEKTQIAPSVVYRHVKKIQKAVSSHPEILEKLLA